MSADKGKLVGGRYELVELAGEGGMATVWRANMHGAMGFTRPVAVKKVKKEYRAIKNYIDMFVEEARVGSELNHPNIVQVHDFCTDEDGALYLVMEWVEGLDLGSFIRSFVRAGTPTPWPLVCAIGIGALRGLGAAHERRRLDGSPAPVVHRDVSPHNILLGVNGIVKLSDFGLARARDRVFSLTAPGTVKGKLSYLSPEVTLGQPAAPASDLFSMGAVLWEALSGRRLFDAPADLEVFRLIRRCDVPSLAEQRADLPPRLVAAVAKALSRSPADRFRSARQMALELAEVLKGVPATTDAQTALGTGVIEARKRLTARRLSQAPEQPTWTFQVGPVGPGAYETPAPGESSAAKRADGPAGADAPAQAAAGSTPGKDAPAPAPVHISERPQRLRAATADDAAEQAAVVHAVTGAEASGNTGAVEAPVIESVEIRFSDSDITRPPPDDDSEISYAAVELDPATAVIDDED